MKIILNFNLTKFPTVYFIYATSIISAPYINNYIIASINVFYPPQTNVLNFSHANFPRQI